MDTRTKRPVRNAVSLGLGAALVATAGIVAVTPVVTALASQSAAVGPAAARPAPAALHATVVRTALATAVTPQGHVHGVSCAGSTGCTLSAMGGTVDVKDGSTSGTRTLDVWKFADTTGATGADVPAVGASSAGAGSPVLEGEVGTTMKITIHNALSIPVGLSIPQLDSEGTDGLLELHDVTLDADGRAVVGAAASGDDKTYEFTPNRAGTFTYQAALTDDGSRGVAMGLVGALVVRPSSGQTSAKVGAAGIDAGAYDGQEDPAAFDDEAVLVYTDVDSAMTADPIGFNMRKYRADYHLINGQAYPDIPAIGSAPGNVVMLRVVNGSILEKSPTILGTRFNEFATGSRPLPTRLAVSGRLVQTGDTFDALVTMPDVDKVRYAIYDAPGTLRNGDEVNLAASLAKNAPALGGGFVLIDSGFADGGLMGAAVTNLSAAGQPGSGSSPLSFSADFASRDNADVTAAELYVDSLATPHPLDFTSAVPDTIPTTVTPTPCGTSCHSSWTLDGSVLGGLSSGVHLVWVRAQTGNSAWGPYALIKVRVDNVGPAATQLTLSDPTTNATTDLDITATLDERTTGGSMVTAGRYWISTGTGETGPGSATVQGPLTVNGPRLIASGDATVPVLVPDPADPTPATPTLPLVASEFTKLAEDTYQLYVQGQDDRGTWGAPKAETLVIDKTAPVTESITLDPAATNGLQGSATKPGNIRITTTVSDALSKVTSVDGYLDLSGTPGGDPGAVKPAGNANGIYFSHGTGTTWSADVPLSWLTGKKTDGPVTVYVVGTDAAGNRGDGSTPATPVTLNLDRTKAVLGISGFAQTATYPTNRNLTFTLTGTDFATLPVVGSGIVYAEWFVGTDPGQGRATPVAGPLGGVPAAGPFTADVSYDLWRAGVFTPTTLSITLRARDAAGNWSQVTVKTPTPTGSLLFFSNGFEAGQLARTPTGWNAGSAGPVAVGTGGNSLAGSQSLRAGVAVPTPTNARRPAAYYAVNVTVPQLAGAALNQMRAGFVFSPRGVATRCASGGTVNTCSPKGVTIFDAAQRPVGDVLVVQYGRASTTSRVMFRVGVREASGIVYGAWSTRPAATRYTVTVTWASTGASSRPTVQINGTTLPRPAGSANPANLVTTVAVGVVNTIPVATLGQTGYFLFDSVSIA